MRSFLCGIKMKKFPSLKTSGEFSKVYSFGKKYRGETISLFVLKNDLEFNRLGISVGKKRGNSVERHRFSRVVRESFKNTCYPFDFGIDIIVVANVRLYSSSSNKIRNEYFSLIHRVVLN